MLSKSNYAQVIFFLLSVCRKVTCSIIVCKMKNMWKIWYIRFFIHGLGDAICCEANKQQKWIIVFFFFSKLVKFFLSLAGIAVSMNKCKNIWKWNVWENPHKKQLHCSFCNVRKFKSATISQNRKKSLALLQCIYKRSKIIKIQCVCYVFAVLSNCNNWYSDFL